jgi:hypothetical protein
MPFLLADGQFVPVFEGQLPVQTTVDVENIRVAGCISVDGHFFGVSPDQNFILDKFANVLPVTELERRFGIRLGKVEVA